MFTDTINTSDIILSPWGLITGERGCQVQSELAGEFFQTTQADSVDCSATQDILKLSLPIPLQPSSWLRTFKEPFCLRHTIQNFLFTRIHFNENLIKLAMDVFSSYSKFN